MSDVTSEMRSIVMEAAGGAAPGERVSASIHRASRRLGLSYSRARSYYYDLVRLVPAEEADRLRAIRKEIMTDRLQRLDAEAATIRARLEPSA